MMFDSKINRQVPGKISLFGWPWHGLVTQKKEDSTQMSVTLPNDETIDLKAYFRSQSMGGENAFAQPGTVLRFRDPRAQDAERSVEQLEKDQVAGIEWRPDVLYSPGERLLYGMTDRLRYGQGWIWHDGLNNWVVTFTSVAKQLYLRCLTDKRQPRRHIDITGQLLNTSRVNVIDALPDGAGIIVGAGWTPEKYKRDERADAHHYLSGAHVASYVAIYEIKLSMQDGRPVAVSSLISGKDEISGIEESDYSRTFHITSRTGNLYSDSELMEHGTCNMTGDIGVISTDLTYLRPNGYIKTFTANHSLTDCVISAFYKQDGSVGLVTANFMDHARVDGSEVDSKVPFEMTGCGTTETFVIPPLEQDVLANSTAEAELVVDGEILSRITVSTTSNHSWVAVGGSIKATIVRTPNSLHTSLHTTFINNGIVRCTNTGEVEIKVAIDGVLVSEESFTYEIESSLDLNFPTPRTSRHGPPSFGPGWEFLKKGDGFSEPYGLGNNANISVMRYAGNAFAFAYERRRDSDMKWYSLIGPVVVPGHGVVDGAVKDRGWKESHGPLYGSFNPITGEMVRDSKSAVFWV